MRRGVSLRTRLTLFMSAALIFLLMIIVAVAGFFVADYVRQEPTRLLEQHASMVADLVHQGPDGRLSIPNLDDLARNGVTLQVLDRTGRVVASSASAGNVRMPPPGLLPPRPGHPRGTVVVERPIRNGDDRIGTVRAGAEIPGMPVAIRSTRNIFMIILLLGVPGSVALAWVLSRQTVQPLEQLISTATAITHSRDLSRRVEAAHRTDELGRLAAAFNTMLDELQVADREREEVLAAQRRFLADASHNLRTPLTIILGHLDLLRRVGDDAEALRLARTEIEVEARHMSRLVSDLLTLARADAGVEVAQEPVLLGDLLADLVRRYSGRNPDLNVSACGLEALEGRAVLGQGSYLQQLFALLLDNACKYTAAGGQVAVQVELIGEQVQVRVTDTGVGIPDEALPRIFERFYRAPNATSLEGAGLGLAIARWIAEVHAGTIMVQSKPGCGTTFQVLLPLMG